MGNKALWLNEKKKQKKNIEKTCKINNTSINITYN